MEAAPSNGECQIEAWSARRDHGQLAGLRTIAVWSGSLAGLPMIVGDGVGETAEKIGDPRGPA